MKISDRNMWLCFVSCLAALCTGGLLHGCAQVDVGVQSHVDGSFGPALQRVLIVADFRQVDAMSERVWLADADFSGAHRDTANFSRAFVPALLARDVNEVTIEATLMTGRLDGLLDRSLGVALPDNAPWQALVGGRRRVGVGVGGLAREMAQVLARRLRTDGIVGP